MMVLFRIYFLIKKRSISPYGKAKLMSFMKQNISEKKKIKAYNAIIFNLSLSKEKRLSNS